MKKFYLTTPIYYVNDEPHIGHTYTTIIADVISRYYKSLGYETFFLTGTDEHGAKINEAAKKYNLEPKQYCDMIAEKFKSTWQELSIKYSNFVRTTDEYHKKTVQLILQKIYDKGDVYKSNYEGLYCINCEKFISEEELIDGVCPDHNTKPILHKEENYFFCLSKYKDIIFEKIKNGEIQVIPEARKNEILGKLQLQLEDISISRKSLKWGINLPFDNDQIVYVWIDALINYLSGIDFFEVENKPSIYKKFWPCDLHLIGKDILWFHAVIWPAILLSLGIDLPKKILAHGFFTVEGKKMSKTLGNVIKPKQLLELFGVDATRMLILSTFPLGTDGNFSLSEMKEKYNQDLADNYGNLITRTFGMIQKYFGNNMKISKISYEMKGKILECVKNYKVYFENFELHKISDTILSLTSFANKYIQEKTPWVLAKEKKFGELKQILSDLLFCIKSATLLFYPIMPNVSLEVLKSFSETNNFEEEFILLLKDYEVNITKEKIYSLGILFKKLQ
ncbi:MAG: methionine--tRNA ligase [Endomicrobiia bacterium]